MLPPAAAIDAAALGLAVPTDQVAAVSSTDVDTGRYGATWHVHLVVTGVPRDVLVVHDASAFDSLRPGDDVPVRTVAGYVVEIRRPELAVDDQLPLVLLLAGITHLTAGAATVAAARPQALVQRRMRPAERRLMQVALGVAAAGPLVGLYRFFTAPDLLIQLAGFLLAVPILGLVYLIARGARRRRRRGRS